MFIFMHQIFNFTLFKKYKIRNSTNNLMIKTYLK